MQTPAVNLKKTEQEPPMKTHTKALVSGGGVVYAGSGTRANSYAYGGKCPAFTPADVGGDLAVGAAF